MKQVRTWLNMIPVDGKYPIPTSEAAYKQNIGLIDVALPVNAGTLQVDGTWAQHSGSSSVFARELPKLARSHGQRYVPVANPGHGSGIANLLVVLDDSALQRKAARELVSLATGRFDAPWDGVMYDGINVPVGHLAKHENFLMLLSKSMRAAGIRFEFACKGYTEGERNDLPNLPFVAEIADAFDFYCYGWREEPRSIGPIWWQKGCIRYALDSDIPARKLHLGFALFSRYWLNEALSPIDMITYRRIRQMIADNDWTVVWVGMHKTGQVSESHADIGTGDLWISDERSVQARLSLIDQYSLGGAMPFLPGWGSELVWQTIAEWKQPVPEEQRPTDRFYQGTNWCA